MMTLTQVRRLLGIGLREFAREAQVGKDTVCRIETKQLDPKDATYGNIMRIVRTARRLGLPGLTVEELFPIEDDVVPQ